MIKRILAISFLLLCAISLSAQRNRVEKTEPVIVIGKTLNQRDSIRVKELFFDGLQEKLSMNYAQAESSFSKVLELDPANDAAMYELANISLAANKPGDAERLLRKAVTVSPENEWYWALLSDIYKRTNKIDDLVFVLEELSRISPKNESYYYDKANALLILKRVEDAEDAYDEIEKRFGSSDNLVSARQRVLMQQGKSAKLSDELEKQILSKPEDLRNYIYLSEVYVKAGERQKAVEILNRAKEISPANAMVRLALADNYKALRQFENTFIELKVAFEDPDLNIDEKVRIVLSFFPMFADMKARAYANELASIMVRVHPDEAKAHAVNGDVLFQERKYPQAQESYKKALAINDQVYQIWEQLLRIEVSRGEFELAIADGDQALSIFPNQAALYLYTGIGYAQTQKHDKAIVYLKSALDLETEDKEILVQIYSAMGDSFNYLKQFKESDQAYTKALELDPKNSYVLNNYAYYLSLRGENLDEAERMSRRSNELDPDNASSEDTYAWILFKLKKYTEARTWIERALRHNSKSAVQVEHYGDILYFLGEKEKAVEQWQKAKEIGSRSDTLEKKINEKKYID
ncbi:MAG: tetratricopeptide repeat protein [Daejeonella sp.]|uniref:tetratricopeptide repeat protein n=1 Tax=Daejeonella sp. TaxID=2805397 RepID=UPI002734C6FC|nr:tetratricopeptide repeat protein [Daejeonella sp.]MDP3467798.1 tetratricopeptide repeat protein [Daejeonella sp.]